MEKHRTNESRIRSSFHYSVLFLVFLLVTLNGCRAASTSSATQPDDKKLEFKNTVVSLTFDDGNADNFVVREDLSSNNLRATFYVVSGFTGMEGYMTEDQLRALDVDGNEIGGHSLSHGHLPKLPDTELRQQVCQDRLNLLALGFDAVSFAYPGGEMSEAVKQMVKDCGYNNARARGGGPETIPAEDVFSLRPMPYIVTDATFHKMRGYINQTELDGGGWVIFTFHHICDECDAYAIPPKLFSKFADWLGEQQANGLVIKTVGEVVGGEVKPGVAP